MGSGLRLSPAGFLDVPVTHGDHYRVARWPSRGVRRSPVGRADGALGWVRARSSLVVRARSRTEDPTMAQWVSRPRADGGMSVQIKWRMDGRWQCETFTDARRAAEFRTAVELAGHRWPTGWLKGRGWQPIPSCPRRRHRVRRSRRWRTARKGTSSARPNGPGSATSSPVPCTTCAAPTPCTWRRRSRALDFTAIDADDISEWIDTLIDAGAAAKTIHEHHGLLSSIIKHGSLADETAR